MGPVTCFLLPPASMTLQHAAVSVRDANPAFGLRGCRIAAVLPQFVEVVVTALVHAILDLREEAKELGTAGTVEQKFADGGGGSGGYGGGYGGGRLAACEWPVALAIPCVTSDHEFDQVARQVRISHPHSTGEPNTVCVC